MKNILFQKHTLRAFLIISIVFAIALFFHAGLAYAGNFIVIINGAGSGIVSGGGIINCSNTCTVGGYSGATWIYATAYSGSHLASMSGGVPGYCPYGSPNQCMIGADDVPVYVTFDPDVVYYTLSVSKSGSGTVSGSGINCGATCSASLPSGTGVTLTAAASSGYQFSGWSGACSGTGSCSVTMNAAKSVTATFTANPTLTVSKSGSGSGTVTGSSINCGTTCSASYGPGTPVTLTASASSGYSFKGWSGCDSTSGTLPNQTCTVNMAASKSATATFGTIKSANIAYVIAPQPTADIKANGSDGPVNVAYNGSATVSWSSTGATSCSVGGTSWTGTSGSQTVTNLTVDKTYTLSCSPGSVTDSVFVDVAAQPQSLVVVKAGQGTVTSTSNPTQPTQINCGSPSGCSVVYPQGTTITLTETPNTGRIFTGWSGVVCNEGSQRSASCTFNLGSNFTIIASFAVDPNYKEF